MSRQLPPLDLHAHIDPGASAAELERLGAVVFAATRSLDEYESVRSRRDQVTIWGLGCHPGIPDAQRTFDAAMFAELLASAAYVSEVGLDGRSKVPPGQQERVFESILEVLGAAPRIVSIHSSGAPVRVLDALERRPVRGAVLHWWRGDATQTRRAIALGCRFSINAAGARCAEDLAEIPIERILTETDHPSGDRRSPAPRQPGAVVDVEETLAQTRGVDPQTFRRQVWENFVALVDEVDVDALLPAAVRRMTAFTRTRQEDR